MGTIKDRNGRHLVEAEEIKKRWKEYKEEESDNHNGAVSHQSQTF